MVGRFHRALRAAIVGAFVFTGFSADAARVRLPHHEPTPIFSPVVAEQLKNAVRRGEAVARKVFGVDKGAGKAAARKGQDRKQDLKPVRLPESGPIPTDNPAKTTVAEAATKPAPSKAAAGPPQKLTAKQARAAAKRGKAAAAQVVVWAGRAGRAIVRTAKTERTKKEASKTAGAGKQAAEDESSAPQPPKNDLSRTAAAKPTPKLTAKQARAAAKRSKAAAREVVA